MWISRPDSIHVGEPIQIRCIIWTTNTFNRGLSEFTVEPESDDAIKNRTMYTSPHQSSLVIQMIDEYSKSKYVGELKPRGCGYRDESGKSIRWLRHIQVECKPPSLTWQPKEKESYQFSDTLTCQVTFGCDEPEIKWIWVAGPIPQLTYEADRFPTDHIGQYGSKLHLSVLPRGGNYVFRCSASCSCSNQPISNTVQVGILVGSDSVVAEWESMDKTLDDDIAMSDLPIDEVSEPLTDEETKDTFESGAHDPMRRSSPDHDRDAKALADAESESWMSVEPVDDNMDSVGQNQYMAELRRRQAKSEDLKLDEVSAEKEDRRIQRDAISAYSDGGAAVARKRTFFIVKTLQFISVSVEETCIGEIHFGRT